MTDKRLSRTELIDIVFNSVRISFKRSPDKRQKRTVRFWVTDYFCKLYPEYFLEPIRVEEYDHDELLALVNQAIDRLVDLALAEE